MTYSSPYDIVGDFYVAPSNVHVCPRPPSTFGVDTRSRKSSESAKERYSVVERHDGIELIPPGDDPFDALRDEFADVKKTRKELRERARETVVGQRGG